jgi:hypothetical protein
MSTSLTPSHSRRPRIPFLVAGVLTGVVALTLLVSGAGLLWADGQKDGDGYLSTDRHAFGTGTAALVTGNVDVNLDGAEWLVESRDLDDVRLSVEPQSAEPVFVGVAPTSDVRRYLGGTAHTRVDDLSYEPFGVFGDFSADYRDSAGSKRADRPGNERFWTTSVSGTGTQNLTWDLAEGDWSIVVMNADGSPGVHADIEAGAQLPALDEIAWTTVGGGVIFAIITAGLVALAVQPRRAPVAAPGGATTVSA